MSSKSDHINRLFQEIQNLKKQEAQKRRIPHDFVLISKDDLKNLCQFASSHKKDKPRQIPFARNFEDRVIVSQCEDCKCVVFVGNFSDDDDKGYCSNCKTVKFCGYETRGIYKCILCSKN